MSHKEDFLKSCLVLDFETNSDKYQTTEPIESGFVILQDGKWNIYSELHRPVRDPIPPDIEALCYITNEMVEDKPPFEDSKETFKEVVDSYSSGYYVAHSHVFDKVVMENYGMPTDPDKWICTWRMATKLFNGLEGVQTNLGFLRFYLKLDVPLDMYCHRAGNDSFITAKLLEVFVDLMEEMTIIDKTLPYGPQIISWLKEPIIHERMPFGKYKGELMTEIPDSYWQWAFKNTEWFIEGSERYDEDLVASIAHAMEKKN